MTAAHRAESLRRAGRTLWLGLRSTVLLPPRTPLPALASPLGILVLVVLDVATVTAAGRFSSDDVLKFDPNGLPSAAAAVLAIALVFLLLAGLLRRETRLIDAFAVSLVVVLLVDLLWLALQFVPGLVDRIDEMWPVGLPLAGVAAPWIAIAVGQLMSTQARGFLRRFVVMLVAVVLIGAPLAMFDRGLAVWGTGSSPAQPGAGGEPEVDASAPDQAHADENLIYGESERLEQALAQLTPRTPGRINLYFVGFAGNGEQMVFTREVTYVKNLLEERFGAAGHTVVLLNNFYTPSRVPLATATSLDETLAAVGERMSDDDVLVLFMTSHGSRQSGINVALPPLELDDIDPATLKDMLDRSHIRKRVIIISACYAGIFVQPLASPDTLVITAADATHTSFGCSNEADFTYFGEAYFHDSLAHTNSFSEAFDAAVPLIQQREDAQGFKHSNPQMSMGESIREQLSHLATQTGPVKAGQSIPSGATKGAL